MKLPFLPIRFDEFYGGSSCSCSSDHNDPSSSVSFFFAGAGEASIRPSHTLHDVFFLSHFHTDHLRGLSSSWGVGYRPEQRILYCSRITRALVLHEFGEALAPYVVALPLFQWLPVPVTPSYSVECCFLPACHIPGSVQILLRSFLGTILYTGDVRFNDDLLRVMDHVVKKGNVSIDHVYLDDTWLHLKQQPPPPPPQHHQQRANNSFDKSKQSSSKILSDEELQLAFEAIKHRVAPLVEKQQRQHRQQQELLCRLQQQQEATECTDVSSSRSTTTTRVGADDDTDINGERNDVTLDPTSTTTTTTIEKLPAMMMRAASQALQRPYVIRIYLHNQFGKEILVQRLARLLGTTVVVDDARYQRLQVITATYPQTPEEVRDEREALLVRVRTFFSLGRRPEKAGQGVEDVDGAEQHLEADVLKCCSDEEAGGIHMGLFVPHSQLTATLHSYRDGDEEGGSHMWVATTMNTTSLDSFGCGIEIVDHRSLVSMDTLRELTARSSSSKTPAGMTMMMNSDEQQQQHVTYYFGLIMTGWARLHRQELEAHELLWQIPFSLHSTSSQLYDAVRVMTPRSVTPIHYERQRGGFQVLKHFGSLFRQPFVNQVICASSLVEAVVPLSLREYIYGDGENKNDKKNSNKENSIHLTSAWRLQRGGRAGSDGGGCRGGVRLREAEEEELVDDTCTPSTSFADSDKHWFTTSDSSSPRNPPSSRSLSQILASLADDCL